MSEKNDGGGRREGALCLLPPSAFLFLLAACAVPPTPNPSLVGQTVLPSPAPLPTLTAVPSPVPGAFFVDAAQDLGPVSPLVYGTNYGPWLFVPLQMQEAVVDARLTSIRFPGGNWGDQNDLDEWSVDQFIAFTRQVGAEPFIHVRLKGGTAQKAADLVRLVNVQKKYGVRYWAIGNEPNLYGDGYDVTRFNQEWREWATAMPAVDPSIVLIGPETSQFCANAAGAYETGVVDWLGEFLKTNGDMLDMVSVHRYPFPACDLCPPPTIPELRADSPNWDLLIPAVRALARENTGRDLPVAVTEANSSWAASSGGEATLNSHFNAIWWGDVLGRLIRQGAFMVNQFAIIGDYGLMGNYEVKPTYYVYRMYRNFGDTLVYAASDDPGVSIFAAKRADGALTLMLVNLASTPVEKPLTLDGFRPAGSAETWRFDQEHSAEPVAPTPLNAAVTLRLPAESMTLLIVEPAQ